jgi:hypothetical protein
MSTRRVRVRESFQALGALTALMLLLTAAPAQAVRTPVEGELYGVAPHSTTAFAEPKVAMGYHGGPVMHSTNTYAIYWDPTTEPFGQYDGDWKALVDQYLADVGKASGTLGNVFAVASQYTDSTAGRAANSSTFRGAYTDTTPYPTSGNCTDPNPAGGGFACVTDTQMRAELNSFITAHGLRVGLDTMYFLLTPPGVTVCTDVGTATGHCSDSKPSDAVSYGHSFCSYHAAINPLSASPIVYAVQPWTAGNFGMYLAPTETLGETSGVDCQGGSGVQQEPNQLTGLDSDGDWDRGLADLIINELSVEQFAMMTDTTLNGWYTGTGNEAPDQCRNFFKPTIGGTPTAPTPPDETKSGTLFDQQINGDNYYLNTAFNQAALTHDYPGVPCVPGVNLIPLFTAPNPVNVGDIVGFDATESDVSLGATMYEWNFGDGSTPVKGASLASVFHSFGPYGETHEVKLTVTDGGGNSATATKLITVVGPVPPGPHAPITPSLSPTTTTSTPGATGSTAKSFPNPVASETVVSRSLAKVLRRGLVVRYSVNEQVTGRFEVLLDRSIARRLGISGAAAASLAAGSAPQVVIAKAILVTTKGGHNTVRIQFSKRTASLLRRLHKVSLTLRMVVRNASSHSPASTTVLSTVTLTR